MSLVARLAGAILSLAIAGEALANNYGGSVSDDTTGPIPAGVHVVTNALFIPGGKTLTISAGAILKFSSGHYLTLDGTLLTNGTGAQPVIFTTIADDSAGGDTNGDGASSGTPGTWYGLLAHAGGAASVLKNTQIRYAGYANYGGIQIEQTGSNFTLMGCTIRNCSNAGINFQNSSSSPSITGCSFQSNGASAIDNVQINSVPAISGNTATGNGGNYIRVTNGAPFANLAIGPSNCMNGSLLFDAAILLPAGIQLTVLAGSVFKFTPGKYVTLDGTLTVNGTAGSPVYFTAVDDDSVGGDTNGDGPSAGTPGLWYGLLAHTSGSASAIDHAEVRYAGYANYGGIQVEYDGSNFALTHSVIRSCGSAGVNMVNTASFPTISNCSFIGNGGRAIDNARIDSLVGLTNNSVSGNGQNCIRVSNNTLLADCTVVASNCAGGAIFIDTGLQIPAGKTLTLQPGVVLKFNAGDYVYLDGTLDVNGTAAQQVVFTSIADDSWGGDTDSGGPTSGSPGTWYGLIAHTTGAASNLDHALIRYAGYGGYGGIQIEQPNCDLTLINSTIRDCGAAAINLGGQYSKPQATYCAFNNNVGVAVDNARFEVLGGFNNDVVTGNGGNYIRITNGTLTTDASILKANCIGGALAVAAQLIVPLGLKLNLQAGVVLKFGGAGYVAVHGALEFDGNPNDPVVFTSIADDAYGGDTNGDGAASLPGAGTWYGIEFQNSGTAVPSLLKHGLLRYAGYGGYPSAGFYQPLIGALDLRTEHNGAVGYRFTSGGAYVDSTAFDCAGDGFLIQGGNAIIARATAAKCNGAGINAAAAFTGPISSAVAWGNSSGNIVGLTAGELLYSDGAPALAGSNGNLNADPLFKDMNNGDLTLLAGSPCIDKGDPLDAPALAQDGTGVPRYLDGDLNVQRRVDMGAYEFDNVRLKVSGNLTPGGSMTLDVTGTAGLNVLMFVGTAPGAVVLPPAGALFIDLSSTWLTYGWGTVPSSLTIPLPPTFPPLPLFLQALAYPPAGGKANLSNPVDASIH